MDDSDQCQRCGKYLFTANDAWSRAESKRLRADNERLRALLQRGVDVATWAGSEIERLTAERDALQARVAHLESYQEAAATLEDALRAEIRAARAVIDVALR